jgi:hypothetical protein
MTRAISPSGNVPSRSTSRSRLWISNVRDCAMRDSVSVSSRWSARNAASARSVG